MRRLSLVLICALAACSSKSSRQLVILHTNDEHSHLLGLGPETDDFPPPTAAGSGKIKGGIARRAVKLASERDAATAAGAATVTVSAGDNMMGTLSQVAATTASPDYRLMSLLKYDVTTLGNHEFDYGPANLAKIISVAKASNEGLPNIVASNIHFSGTAGDATLAALYDAGGTDSSKPIHDWTVVERGGLRIGFIGIMGADAAAVAPLKAPVKFSVAPGVDESVRVASLAQIVDDVQATATALKRDQHCDLVVALSHGGADVTAPDKSEDFFLAQNLENVDVIISGHSHTEVPATVITRANGHQTLVQQAGRFGDNVGKIVVNVDGDGHVSFDTTSSGLLKVDDTIVGDATINAFVTNVIGSLETQPVDGVAGHPSYAALALLHSGVPQAALADKTHPGDLLKFALAKSDFDVDNSHKYQETQLLTFVADAQLATARVYDSGVQGALEAYGVTRVSSLQRTAQGTIAFGDVFATVPLGAGPGNATYPATPGYPLVVTNIYYAELKAAFELSAGYAYAGHDDLYVVPSGFKFEYDTTRPMFNPAGSATSPANGRVTKIYQLKAANLGLGAYDGEAAGYDVIFDAADTSNSTFPGWLVSPLGTVRIAANLYIATFATFAGIHLKSNAGAPVPGNDPTSQIVYRSTADGSDVKEWEAVSGYALGQAQANGGKILAKYGTGSPRRAICVGVNATNGVCTH